MIAMALASENVATAKDAESMPFGDALEYNVRLQYRHQQIQAQMKR